MGAPIMQNSAWVRRPGQRKEWERRYHYRGGSPRGTEYYHNEAPYDQFHVIVRMVPPNSLERRYRRSNEETLTLIYAESPTYSKVTEEYIRHEHSPLWVCGIGISLAESVHSEEISDEDVDDAVREEVPKRTLTSTVKGLLGLQARDYR